MIRTIIGLELIEYRVGRLFKVVSTTCIEAALFAWSLVLFRDKPESWTVRLFCVLEPGNFAGAEG